MIFLHLKGGYPSARQLKIVVDTLRNDGLMIYPTDTVYAIGCSILSPKAIERLIRLKKNENLKALPAIICKDISQLSDYGKLSNNQHFKTIKKNTPGAFTFILSPGPELPRSIKKNRKTVGIRIPDHPFPREIIEALDHAILSTSVRTAGTDGEYLIDPFEIRDHFGHLVDVIVEDGNGTFYPSTIVDLTGPEVEILRQGRAELE